MIHQTTQQSGFTLVEVLVAITILLLVIVGPMNIITQANNSSAFAAEQAQAFFLAQEGVELAQKIRGDLLIDYFATEFSAPGSGVAPFSVIASGGVYDNCFNLNIGCGLTIANNASVDITNCRADGTGCRLYTNADANDRSRFIHNGAAGNETLYTRKITLEPVGGTPAQPDSLEVTSTVTWRTGSLIASQEVVLTSYLFDIYDTN